MIMPPILTSTGALVSGYDALICDIWGVVHDGRQAYRGADALLRSYRRSGGHVLLLSNSPMPAEAVVHVLDSKGVNRDVADAIVTSGDITRAHVAAMGYGRVHHIGPDRDLVLFAGTGLTRVPLDEAQAILCTGLIDDINETGESYRPLLTRSRALGLPFVCANPDLVVDVGGVLLPCAGTLAALYESLGGAVYWAGKPYAPAYERAFAVLDRLTGGIERQRILAIGDALRTDIAGAAGAGLDALLIGQGIHRDELMPDGMVSAERVGALLATAPAEVAGRVVAAAAALAP